jgi:hypothetical protein
VRKNISDNCEERLKALINLCSDIQAENRPEVIDVDIEHLASEIWEHSDHWTNVENHHRHSRYY